MLRRLLGSSAPPSLSGMAYGVPLTIEAPDKSLLARMRNALPVAWVEGEPSPDVLETAPGLHFRLTRDEELGYQITLNDRVVLQDTLDEMLSTFVSMSRQYVAAESRDFVFVHAGAVAHNGRGIVIPGDSFSGKTTLVAALARAGAQYYSDEYAVIRPDGLLVPYPKDLSLRLVPGERAQTDHTIAEIGGVPGTEPVKVGLLVLTEYRSTAGWNPAELSPAQGLVEMLAHTEPVQERPQISISSLSRALADAKILHGQRGDADETAAALLAMLA